MSVSIGMTATAMTMVMMSAVQAQPPMPAHYSWAGEGGEIDMYLQKGGISVVDVNTGKCLGNVGGQAKVVGRTVVLTAKDNTSEDICVLRITFNGNYTRASIKEKNCNRWHGASCGFAGPVLRRQKLTRGDDGL